MASTLPTLAFISLLALASGKFRVARYGPEFESLTGLAANFPTPEDGLRCLGNCESHKNSSRLGRSSDDSFFVYSTFKATAEMAFWYCEVTGLQLLSIESERKMRRLIGAIKENAEDSGDFCHPDLDRTWTSGIDTGSDFRWKSTGELIRYTRIVNENSLDRNCVLVDRDVGYNWLISYCHDEYYFICELRL